ncbi:hypothetical protein ACFOYW_00555 [Gryllotalpicola reticulitermitis]|uniref:Uncharacterized protein n=1 Tax=Gryllotalpicola reticulitermitis TaxID=1184153 RepID=A0ABV8Q0Q1_9MICO
MEPLRSRVAAWLRRWWVAVAGAILVVAGVVVFQTAGWTIPRGTATYTSATPFVAVAFLSPRYVLLQHVGETLMLLGAAAIATSVVVRVIRARRGPRSSTG